MTRTAMISVNVKPLWFVCTPALFFYQCVALVTLQISNMTCIKKVPFAIP
jgi:hypothetical protein